MTSGQFSWKWLDMILVKIAVENLTNILGRGNELNKSLDCIPFGDLLYEFMNKPPTPPPLASPFDFPSTRTIAYWKVFEASGQIEYDRIHKTLFPFYK